MLHIVLEVLEVLDKLEPPRREVDELKLLSFDNYLDDIIASYEDNDYVCNGYQ